MSTELKIWGKGLWKINDKDLRKYLKFVSTKRDNLLLLSPFAIWENQVWLSTGTSGLGQWLVHSTTTILNPADGLR